MKRPITRISWGLFCGSFWMKLKDIPIFFQRIWYTLRHGYPPQATWEMYEWHRRVMLEVLAQYRNQMHGWPEYIPTEDGNCRQVSFEEWGDIIDEMCAKLNDMDEDDGRYDEMSFHEESKAREQAKNDFFHLFSLYYYNLWD